jgi:hypothetical protein
MKGQRKADPLPWTDLGACVAAAGDVEVSKAGFHCRLVFSVPVVDLQVHAVIMRDDVKARSVAVLWGRRTDASSVCPDHGRRLHGRWRSRTFVGSQGYRVDKGQQLLC